MTDRSRTILALDLSTPRGLITVLRADQVIYEASFTAERSHNAQVFAPLEKALDVIGDESATLVIGTGPGSYTGVRIAIAAAQGIALSRGWPVIGWPSLTTAPLADYQVIGDARRGMYYLTSVTQHSLGEIEIVDAITAQERVEAGGTWFSFDGKPPLALSQVQLCPPNTKVLARIISLLSEEEVQTRAGTILEPIYLQEAFITTAKKVGKKVPTV